MNFKFGKKIINKQNNIYKNENKDLDDKLDNIYESIQNIVFNEPKINKLKQNEIKFNFEPNINLLQKEKNMIKKINKDEILIKNKKDNLLKIYKLSFEVRVINYSSNFVK